jgi:hypothetical protein
VLLYTHAEPLAWHPVVTRRRWGVEAGDGDVVEAKVDGEDRGCIWIALCHCSHAVVALAPAIYPPQSANRHDADRGSSPINRCNAEKLTI